MRTSAAVPVLLLLAGCGLDTIDVDASRRAVIAGNPLGAVPLRADGFTTFDVAGSREFARHGAGPEDIDSVKLASLTVTVEAPSGATLDFIDHVDFYASSPGLPTVKIASLSVSGGARRVHARTLDVELKDHATARTMTITTRVAGRQPPADTTVRVDAVLRVNLAIGPF